MFLSLFDSSSSSFSHLALCVLLFQLVAMVFSTFALCEFFPYTFFLYFFRCFLFLSFMLTCSLTFCFFFIQFHSYSFAFFPLLFTDFSLPLLHRDRCSNMIVILVYVLFVRMRKLSVNLVVANVEYANKRFVRLICYR